MLAEPAPATTQQEPGTPAPRFRLRPAGVAAFVAMFALVLLYALRGGAYDTVAFEEYGLFIWVALAAGVGLGLLPRVRPSRPVLLLLGAVLAYAAWTALSLTWTDSAERTTTEIARVLDYLGVLTLLAMTVGEGEWRAASAGLGAGAMVVCALAVASRLFPGEFPDNAVAASSHFYRLSYPFGYWNALAAWGAMSIALGLGWGSHARWRAVRALALTFVPVAFLAVYLSYSRAGYAGTTVAVVAVLALSRNRATALLNAAIAAAGAAIAALAAYGAPQIANATGTHGRGGVLGGLLLGCAVAAAGALVTGVVRADRWSLPRTPARALGIAAATVIVIAAGAFGPHLVSRAWHSFTRPDVVTQTNDPSQRLLNLSGGRYSLWKVGLKSVARRPVTGTGAGTFEFTWDRHATNPEFVRNAHNIWVQNLAELGVPGGILIVGLALAALWVGITVRRRVRRRVTAGPATAALALMLVYLAHASVDWMWESTAVTVLALGAIVLSGARLSKLSPRLYWWWRVPLVLLALLSAAVQVPGLLSTAEIRRSQSAERAGEASRALAWANDAVSAEPWAAAAYEQRGLVLEAAGQYARAAKDLRRAVANEPDNFAHWLLLARVETERGRLDAAVRDDAQARRLRPLATALALLP